MHLIDLAVTKKLTHSGAASRNQLTNGNATLACRSRRGFSKDKDGKESSSNLAIVGHSCLKTSASSSSLAQRRKNQNNKENEQKRASYKDLKIHFSRSYSKGSSRASSTSSESSGISVSASSDDSLPLSPSSDCVEPNLNLDDISSILDLDYKPSTSSLSKRVSFSKGSRSGSWTDNLPYCSRALTALGISEHDRRILEIMTLKRKEAKRREVFAHEAHLFWELERIEREKVALEETAQWRKIVSNRRHLENEASTKRFQTLEKEMEQSKSNLQFSIRDKESRAAKRKRDFERQKANEASVRRAMAERKKEIVEANHSQIEHLSKYEQELLEQQHTLRLEQASEAKYKHTETLRRRVASANRAEETRHDEMARRIKMETEDALRRTRWEIAERDRRSKDQLEQQQRLREQQIRTISVERESRSRAARQMARELSMGFDRWRAMVAHLQATATAEAALRADSLAADYVSHIKMENRVRSERHANLMRRLTRSDQERARAARLLLEKKERKMEDLAKQREASVQESRLQALATAHLREHVRRTLSPETFDRKVSRVELECRITARCPSSSPPNSHSHIYLG